MSETLTQHEYYALQLSQDVASEQLTALQFGRQQLSLALVDKGLISKELYESGVLENFEIDEATQRDSLKHLLIGDDYVGAHHLPTLIGLGVEGVTIASMIQPQESLKRQRTLGQLRNEQRLRQNGIYKAMDVRFTDRSGNTLRKVGGSSMFPNEWSTQKVIESILITSQVAGKETPDDSVTRHTSEIDGVKVMVITDNRTGKIITGYPK